MQKLPVFFHIPKCAGTYVNSIFSLILTRFVLGEDNIKYIIVQQDEYTLYRLVCTTNKPLNNKYKKQDRWTYFVDYDDLDIDDLNVYFVEVCARSFNDYKNYIYKKLPSDVKPYEFIFLREPYSLTQSLYNYLSSDEAAHEPTHADFKFNKFEEYLNSSSLQGSWLIYSLLNIPIRTPITEEHFDKTCSILDDMLISDMINVDSIILKVVEDCYGLTDKNIIDKITLEETITRNVTKHKIDMQFNDLEEKTKVHFLAHTKWDLKLYNKYK